MTTSPPTTDPSQDPAARRAGALLTIDLTALQENYRRLAAVAGRAEVAPVVKADGYGLGAAKVAPALATLGARRFFVALLEEAVALRKALPAPGREIFVLNGLMPGAEGDYREHGIQPVLNSLGEIEAWKAFAAQVGQPLPAALHIDTGMNRLGLPASELESLAADPGRLAGTPSLVMSHLACAEDSAHPMNPDQLERFQSALARLPMAPASFANSSGLFLGPEYLFDIARPGVALYGVNPTPGRPNPVTQVIRLQGKILQVREIDAPQSVGYGATHRAAGPGRIATVAAGYADGYLRSLSDRATAWLGEQRVPVVGRVSMDLITLDVTDVPPQSAVPGTLVDLIGPDDGLDRLAEEAGTIGYEILTSLGRRYHRVYLDPAEPGAAGA